MSGDTPTSRVGPVSAVRKHLPTRTAMLAWGTLLNIELAAVLIYVNLTSNTVTDPLIVVYPFVWINVALYAVFKVSRPKLTRRRRLIGVAIGLGYFALLLVVGGVVSPGHGLHGHVHQAPSLRVIVSTLPPGWGPTVVYGGTWVTLTLIPYKLIGYAVLAYLVALAVVRIEGVALTGSLGLVSCVSCTWPVLGTLMATLFGGGSVLATLAASEPYGLSTVVFVSAIGLLLWRPFADATPGRSD